MRLTGKYRYLTFEDRKKIEAWHLLGDRPVDIAARLSVHHTTIYKELQRGATGALDTNQREGYSAELAERRLRESFKRRGKRAPAAQYYNGRKVIPITEADGPQKFDDELEARLVKEGVAKYIGELDETAEQPAPAPGDDADEPASTNTAADEAPEYNEDMKLDELKEVAARYGVDASAMRKKADVIAAIEATKAEQPDDGADDEEPPQIGAADPV